jgi:peptide/nickel transport system ATP-binding protein
MLKLENVSKIYKTGTFGGKELHAVSDVSFDMKEGEVISLIGESGSGKSTIGKMILKLISISKGSINFDGKNVADLNGNELKEYYRNVQGVFQDPFSSYNPIFKADRIFSIIKDEFFPEISQGEWKKKLDNSLECVGLNPEHVLNKFPHQLSGGQLQRFLIARALMLDIKFLVADEIISMLDASTRMDVLNLIADLKSRGLAVLFITHDLSLGYYISEKAVILYKGCVVEMGATDKIYHNPMHPYTRMLMASVPRLDKKWEQVAGEVEIKTKQPIPTTGCVYAGRCVYPAKDENCLNYRPKLRQMEPDHFVSCSKI